ncbi:MAG: sulfotransferase [Pseudomonadota bacterium]
MTELLALEEIRRLQQQGLLEAALPACELASRARPESLDLLALAGILVAQNQEFGRARKILAQLEGDPRFPSLDASVLTDIAGIYILLGESAGAMRYLETVLKLSPDYLLAIMRRGLVSLQCGYITPAIADFTAGLTRLPAGQQAPVLINLAHCYLSQGDTAQALAMVERARQGGAQNREQWVFAAVDCYIALDRWEDAEQAIQEGLQAGIEQNKGLLLWSIVLAAQDKHEEAEHQIRKALRDDPDNVALLTHLATLANIRGHYGEVLHCLHRATQLEPDNAGLWAQLAQVGNQYFDEQAARHAAEKALALTKEKLGLERAQALVAMAHVSADAGQHAEAELYYQDALVQLPDYIPAQMGLGRLWLQWGRVDEATALFESVAQRHPIAGLGALISARRFPDDDAVLANIERMAYIPSLEGSVKSGLLFDLAAVYEHRKEYDRAFHFAREANQASRHYLTYQASAHRDYCQRLQRCFSPNFYRQREGYGHPSTLPVFVCGMPRSGTTLVEQILGGHPDVFVAGEIGMLSGVMQRLNAWERHIGSGQEYPECILDLGEEAGYKFAGQVLDDLRRYDANARHIVDKLPHNFENIGLLRLLFPNAPVIHVTREPRDVAVSNYFINYQAKFGGMGFAYDLSDIGQQLLDYQQLMRHWDATLAKPVLTLRYEDVVEDTETAARTMLAYLGLDWTPLVLNHQNLERAVKTASVWQVRQPIYKTAIEKWRRYASFLAPLEQALAEQPQAPEPAGAPSRTAGLFFQGMDYLHLNQGGRAEQVFRTLLRDHADHAAATHMLGVALMQQNRYSDALPYLLTSIERHPGHVGWYQNVKLAYQRLGRNEDALEMQKKMARRAPFEEHR